MNLSNLTGNKRSVSDTYQSKAEPVQKKQKSENILKVNDIMTGIFDGLGSELLKDKYLVFTQTKESESSDVFLSANQQLNDKALQTFLNNLSKNINKEKTSIEDIINIKYPANLILDLKKINQLQNTKRIDSTLTDDQIDKYLNNLLIYYKTHYYNKETKIKEAEEFSKQLAIFLDKVYINRHKIDKNLLCELIFSSAVNSKTISKIKIDLFLKDSFKDAYNQYLINKEIGAFEKIKLSLSLFCCTDFLNSVKQNNQINNFSNLLPESQQNNDNKTNSDSIKLLKMQKHAELHQMTCHFLAEHLEKMSIKEWYELFTSIDLYGFFGEDLQISQVINEKFFEILQSLVTVKYTKNDLSKLISNLLTMEVLSVEQEKIVLNFLNQQSSIFIDLKSDNIIDRKLFEILSAILNKTISSSIKEWICQIPFRYISSSHKLGVSDLRLNSPLSTYSFKNLSYLIYAKQYSQINLLSNTVDFNQKIIDFFIDFFCILYNRRKGAKCLEIYVKKIVELFSNEKSLLNSIKEIIIKFTNEIEIDKKDKDYSDIITILESNLKNYQINLSDKHSIQINGLMRDLRSLSYDKETVLNEKVCKDFLYILEKNLFSQPELFKRRFKKNFAYFIHRNQQSFSQQEKAVLVRVFLNNYLSLKSIDLYIDIIKEELFIYLENLNNDQSIISEEIYNFIVQFLDLKKNNNSVIIDKIKEKFEVVLLNYIQNNTNLSLVNFRFIFLIKNKDLFDLLKKNFIELLNKINEEKPSFDTKFAAELIRNIYRIARIDHQNTSVLIKFFNNYKKTLLIPRENFNNYLEIISGFKKIMTHNCINQEIKMAISDCEILDIDNVDQEITKQGKFENLDNYMYAKTIAVTYIKFIYAKLEMYVDDITNKNSLSAQSHLIRLSRFLKLKLNTNFLIDFTKILFKKSHLITGENLESIKKVIFSNHKELELLWNQLSLNHNRIYGKPEQFWKDSSAHENLVVTNGVDQISYLNKKDQQVISFVLPNILENEPNISSANITHNKQNDLKIKMSLVKLKVDTSISQIFYTERVNRWFNNANAVLFSDNETYQKLPPELLNKQKICHTVSKAIDSYLNNYAFTFDFEHPETKIVKKCMGLLLEVEINFITYSAILEYGFNEKGECYHRYLRLFSEPEELPEHLQEIAAKGYQVNKNQADEFASYDLDSFEEFPHLCNKKEKMDPEHKPIDDKPTTYFTDDLTGYQYTIYKFNL